MKELKRHLGFASLVIYGIGDILGAGIYALVGKVIGIAGIGAWATFFIAALAAILTGLSYAEMSARYPVNAGAAAYVRRAFPGRLPATLIGVFVLGTGLVSAATVTVAFSDYLARLAPVSSILAQVVLVIGLSFLSFWGIRESSRVNFFLTFVESAGLLAVIIVGLMITTPESFSTFVSKTQSHFEFSGVLSAVTIAFFAYIGFEDLSNLAEESKNPARDIPRAILIAIGVSTLLYTLVCAVLLLHIPLPVIGASDTPLLLIFEKAGFGEVTKYFAIVAMLAITNTGLINLIMASRLMHGMAGEGLIPPVFGSVHDARQTPWIGVITALAGVFILILTGGLKILAQSTSLAILIVFSAVHLSLLRVKYMERGHNKIRGGSGIRFSPLFPTLGLLLCLFLLTQFPAGAFFRSGVLLFTGLLVWILQIRSSKTESSGVN